MNSRKIRVKKLNGRQPLTILKEDEIDATEYESLTQDLQVATGVEAGEENEYHLQVVLKTAGQKVETEIPVPPPQESSTSYEQLYKRLYTEPTSYVRFSQTVEECIGCCYDMTEEDDAFLKEYNSKRHAAQRLSADDFERIMEAFEENASHQTPFAVVDKTVLAYDAMVAELSVLLSPKVMTHAKTIYEHWKSRKEAVGNGSLQPVLKFETHQESDDQDPYICFRRREVRQTRKTRARDVQSADKLKRLRNELEQGRQLIKLSRDREMLKRDMIRCQRMIFQKRALVKKLRMKLGIKGEDEDLVNAKAPLKRRPPETSAAQRSAGSGHVRQQPQRSHGSVEIELPLLETQLARQEEELRIDIRTKIQNHQNWNRNHVDVTRGPLPSNASRRPSFRGVQARYLVTPPSSESGDSGGEPTPMKLDDGVPSEVFRFQGVPLEEGNLPKVVTYRRRLGRLNRLWIDRRDPRSAQARLAHADSDRWKYDQDESDEEQPTYEVDPYDTSCIKFRSTIPLSAHDPRRGHRQIEAAAQAQAAAVQAATSSQPPQMQPNQQGASKPTPTAQRPDKES